MEFLKDVFTPFYERIKRPFIGAFWISVILTNWEVWVALFFYGEKVGSENKITYINDLLKTETLICTPLLYTVIFLIIGQLLDVLAFWWQLCVKRMKNYLKHKSNSGMMVDGQTFNRISQQLNGVKVENTQKTKEISDLEEIIKTEKLTQSNLKHLTYKPTINYFLGQWSLKMPSLTFIKISFQPENNIVKVVLEDNSEEQSNYLPIHRTHLGIIIPIQNEFTPDFIQKIHKMSIGKGNSSEPRFTILLEKETVFWYINLGSITKNEFTVYPNSEGSNIIFKRLVPWTEHNKLWLNDVNNEFALPD